MFDKLSKLNLSKKQIIKLSICVLLLIVFAFQIPTIVRKCSLTDSNKESIECVKENFTVEKDSKVLKSDLIRIIDINDDVYDFFIIKHYTEKIPYENTYLYKNNEEVGFLILNYKPFYYGADDSLFNECKYIYDTYCSLGNSMETLDEYNKVEVLDREIVAAELGIDYEY